MIKRLLDSAFLAGRGYQWWSGVGSDVFLLAPFGWAYRHRNCHVAGCWRIGHIDPSVHHPACKRHHSHADKLGATHKEGTP